MKELHGRDDFFYSITHDTFENICLNIEEISDINHCDSDGVSYLLVAVINDRLDVVKLLLDNGANPNIANKKGILPITMSIGTNRQNSAEISRELILHGANLDLKTGNGKTPRELMTILNKTELLK